MKGRKRFHTNITSFIRSRSGLAAVEFALILPLMLLFLLGAVEITNLLIAERRTTSVAATLGDLVARDDSISAAEMNDIFFASDAVMADLPTANLQMRVSSIIEQNGTAKVAWSRAKNTSADVAGSTVNDLPDGLLTAGGSVIKVVVVLPYTLDTLGGGANFKMTDAKRGIDYDLGNLHTISKTFYLRPRLVLQIPAPA